MLSLIGPGGRLIVCNRAWRGCASLSTVSKAANDGRYTKGSPSIEQSRELLSKLRRTRLKIVQSLTDRRKASDPRFVAAALSAWFGSDQSPNKVELILLCERLTSEGVRLDITLLREIVKLFKGSIESLETALKINAASASEGNRAVNSLIIALVDSGRRDEAFLVAENCTYVTGFARQKLDRPDRDHDQQCRGLEKSILNHLKKGNLEAASTDLKKMDGLRQGPSDDVLADLSWAYLHRGSKLEAMQLFKRIKTPRMALLISLMSKFGAERNLPACEELFSYSKVLSFPLLDLIHVGSIAEETLMGWFDAGDGNALYSQNNPRAVDILVEVLMALGELNEARRLLDTLLNGKIPPSGRSFGRVIVKLCKANDLEGAYSVFLNMRSLQMYDPKAYVSLAGLLRRRHRMKDAFKLSDELTSIYPSSTFSYNCLLDNLLASNNPVQHRRALRVFEEMARKKIPPTDSVYAAVIKAHGKLHNKTECYRFMEEAFKCNGIGVPIASFNSLMFALGEMGDLEDAYRLVVSNSWVEPDDVSYSIVIRCLAKGGRLHEAEELLESQSTRGRGTFEHEYLALMTNYANAGDLSKVESMFRRLLARSKPSATAYNCLIKSYMQNNDFEGAENVFREMKEGPVFPSERTYLSMMKGYNEAGNYKASLEIFLEFSSNRAATMPMLEEAIFAASQSGKHFYVLKLFEDQCLVPSQRTIKPLMIAVAQFVEGKEFQNLLLEMSERESPNFLPRRISSPWTS
ncbi:hypothetical protein NDN08_003263 [Rhodosorus marinus]|uniref:PROP1-like PPR domain-containing protein n=1 Tax=Rhodosorus marinus TaxID=101924 RepID=A0AAV8V0M0_9RHOD|nr:hypothetical protein NDN08_003263 [Rhodosorus marinus]